MFDESLLRDAEALIARCRAGNLKLALAESCTGGLIAACLTEVPGASDVLERGLVVYSNESKIVLLDVPPVLLESEGAVSEAVARAMAEGALWSAPVDLALAVTGIAGPSGGSERKPVGLVHLAAARKGVATIHVEERFGGDRRAIRFASLRAGLRLVNAILDQAR